MSRTPSNLPPGCRESDLPGNRPEDAEYENFLEECEESLFEEFVQENLTEITEFLFEQSQNAGDVEVILGKKLADSYQQKLETLFEAWKEIE